MDTVVHTDTPPPAPTAVSSSAYRQKADGASLSLDKSGCFTALERNNIFDLLRFIAATLVIYAHSFPMLGAGHDPLDTVSGINFGSLGVSLFFVLSGFLITRSWLSNPKIGSYMGARCLRIFPALIFSLLFTVFAIGAPVTSVTLPKYFTSPVTLEFLSNVFLFPIHYPLPGVFTSNPLPGAVNGSLWSLPVEFMMYGVVLALGLLGILQRKFLLLAATIACLLLDIFALSTPAFASRVELTVLVGPSFNMALYFLLGGCFFLFRQEIPKNWRCALVAALSWYLSFKTPYLRTVSYLALPYLFFYLAALPLPALRKFAKYGDFSYGLYVFAFPVQQLLVHLQPHKLSVSELFAQAFTITLLLAVTSWHLVESPCLKLKRHLRPKLSEPGSQPNKVIA